MQYKGIYDYTERVDQRNVKMVLECYLDVSRQEMMKALSYNAIYINPTTYEVPEQQILHYLYTGEEGLLKFHLTESEEQI